MALPEVIEGFDRSEGVWVAGLKTHITPTH
jgi:hypothetical protein